MIRDAIGRCHYFFRFVNTCHFFFRSISYIKCTIMQWWRVITNILLLLRYVSIVYPIWIWFLLFSLW